MKVELDLPDGLCEAVSQLAIHEERGRTFEAQVMAILVEYFEAAGIPVSLDRPFDILKPERYKHLYCSICQRDKLKP